jgi:hypothetical protein
LTKEENYSYNDKIKRLKNEIDHQRELGNNKLADILAADLQHEEQKDEQEDDDIIALQNQYYSSIQAQQDKFDYEEVGYAIEIKRQEEEKPYLGSYIDNTAHIHDIIPNNKTTSCENCGRIIIVFTPLINAITRLCRHCLKYYQC